VTDVYEVGTRSLRKNRRRFADVAKIDSADIQSLKELRAGREFNPLDLDALRAETFFQSSLGLDQRQ